MEFAIPMLGELKSDNGFFPDPMDYTYWKSRESRTFYVDYEVDEDYSLIELGKIIIQMNMDEKNIDEKDLQPIYLWIHSYGGEIDQANFFCDLCMSSRIPIVTIAMGAAMSAGFMIFLAGKRRYAFTHSSLLVHTGSGTISGTAEQIEEAQKNYKKQIGDMKRYILERTTVDEKTFNRNKSKDWYLTSEELVKYNVVDKLITTFADIL